ncbi:hypothetical protein J6590_057116 [Homalodisca vitripennis]|nr:hypothetical protein J6590_057116 [Homalodisca vitripennis]
MIDPPEPRWQRDYLLCWGAKLWTTFKFLEFIHGRVGANRGIHFRERPLTASVKGKIALSEHAAQLPPVCLSTDDDGRFLALITVLDDVFISAPLTMMILLVITAIIPRIKSCSILPPLW